MLSDLRLALIEGPVHCTCYCKDVTVPDTSPAPRRTPDGHAACELCGRQLTKVKHHRSHQPGRACHPRCKPSKRSIDNTLAVQPPAARPIKRAKSDPGEQIAVAATRTLRHRIAAPKPPAPKPKPRIARSAIDVSALLDQTHARRMALIAAEQQAQSAAATAVLNASSVVWQ